MEELKNEQTEVSLESQIQTQVGEQKDAEVSLGRFKDVSALLNAYNSLQAEFTKRCQRIKELESERLSVDKTISTGKPKVEQSTEQERDTTPDDKDEVVREYLKDLFGRRRGAIVMDGVGVGVKTPVRRPKTVRAAGELAKELLGKN